MTFNIRYRLVLAVAARVRNAEERGRYVTGSHIPPQVEQLVSSSAVSEGIWTVGFGALWPLAGAYLTRRCCHE
jgi:hypothetical protein